MIGILLSIGTTLLAGAGLFAWLRSRRSSDLLEALGLSFIFGSALISLLLFGLGWLVQGPILIGLIMALAMAAGGAGWWKLRGAPWPVSPSVGAAAWALPVVLFPVAWQALALPFGGDGLFNFADRAHFGWMNGGQIPLQFFSDPSRLWHHACYPPLVALNQLWLYLCLGEPHQGLAKILGVLWFGAAAALTWSQIARLTGESIRGGIAVGAMLLVPSIIFARGGAVWGWGDFPVGATALAAALYLMEYREHRTGPAVFAGLLATLPWIKREGIILAAVLFAAFLWSTRKERPWKQWIGVALPFVLVAGGWAAFTKWAQSPPVSDFAPPTPGFFWDHLDRISRILTVAIAELGTWQRWSLLWATLLPTVWLILRTPALKRWGWMLGCIGLLIAGYASLYVFSIWPNVVWHMATSYPRLLVAPAMMACVLIAVSVPLRRAPAEKISPLQEDPGAGQGE